jgi:hypothetical protein
MKQFFKGMEIELFSITNNSEIDNGIRIEKIGLRTGQAKIFGKQLFINPINSTDFKPDYKNFYVNCFFNYKFDLPFDIEVKLNSGKKKNLNTEIVYTTFINGKDEAIKVYSYLTCLQKLKLSSKRSQLWIQQSENVMWIINILVAILAIGATIISFK